MKKILLFILCIIPIILTGCFGNKKEDEIKETEPTISIGEIVNNDVVNFYDKNYPTKKCCMITLEL